MSRCGSSCVRFSLPSGWSRRRAGTPFTIEVKAQSVNTARLRVFVYEVGTSSGGCGAVPPLHDETLPPGAVVTRTFTLTKSQGRHELCVWLGDDTSRSRYGEVAQVIDVGERALTLDLSGPGRAELGKRVRMTAEGSTDGPAQLRIVFVRGRCAAQLSTTERGTVRRRVGGDFRFNFTRAFPTTGTWRACGYVDASATQGTRASHTVRVRRR